jgi:hypothetical protein
VNIAAAGRRFLLNSDQRYDLILIDLLRPTIPHCNDLYSHEFFELAARHLNEGGVFMTYMDKHFVMSKTLLYAFAKVRLYEFFELGSNQILAFNASRRERLHTVFPRRVREWVGGEVWPL